MIHNEIHFINSDCPSVLNILEYGNTIVIHQNSSISTSNFVLADASEWDSCGDTWPAQWPHSARFSRLTSGRRHLNLLLDAKTRLNLAEPAPIGGWMQSGAGTICLAVSSGHRCHISRCDVVVVKVTPDTRIGAASDSMWRIMSYIFHYVSLLAVSTKF